MNARPTERFSSRAQAYAANRPGYPPEALDALFDGLTAAQPLTVADVGAGTGISSRLLSERCAHVYAIEPNAAMRERAPADSRVSWIDGTAESTSLPGKFVDVAAAFQAFHWFVPELAIVEFQRISRLRIGLLQYERNESDPFTREYGELVRRFATDDTEGRRRRSLDVFAELTAPRCNRNEFAYYQSLTMQELRGRIDSSSYLPADGEAGQALRQEAEKLFAQFAVDGRVAMAMICYVLLADA